MFCSNCGNQTPDDAKFCKHCGAEILQQINELSQNTNQVKNNHKFALKVLVPVLVIAIITTSCIFSVNKSTNKNVGSLFSQKKNKQITVTTILEKSADASYLTYSFTNGEEYIDSIYFFPSVWCDPETFSNSENVIANFENNYSWKRCFLFENGEYDSNIQIDYYERVESQAEPKLDSQFSFVKDDKKRIVARTDYDVYSSVKTHTEQHLNYSYNENDKIVEISEASEYTEMFSYDETGVLFREDYKDRYGDESIKTYTYEKDEKGNVIKIMQCDDDNILEKYYEYEYDSNNNIVKESVWSFKENGEQYLDNFRLVVYDENENIIQIEENVYSEYSDEFDVTIRKYFYNSNLNIEKVTIEDDSLAWYIIPIYTDTPRPYFVENQAPF